MKPDIKISPSPGESFPEKVIHISHEAAIAVAVGVSLSGHDPRTGELNVSPEAAKEIDKLAIAIADAARGE